MNGQLSAKVRSEEPSKLTMLYAAFIVSSVSTSQTVPSSHELQRKNDVPYKGPSIGCPLFGHRDL